MQNRNIAFPFFYLQIDIVSLYLLSLVQMINSGLQIIYTMDEVTFVQNLVYYVERAYRTPDFGMWERGSKYNNGTPELHARCDSPVHTFLGGLYKFTACTVNLLYPYLYTHASQRTFLSTTSSIGMAKAALEAINGCNLFGEKGASWSVIFVDIDAHNRNRSIFETLLPRESSSKVTFPYFILTICH